MRKILLLSFLFLILFTQFTLANTIYYSQVSVGGGRDVTKLFNWKTAVGSGTSPASFLSGDEFHIVSSDSMIASVAWNIAGAKMVIENGKFNSSGFSHSFTLDMQAAGYYYHTSGTYNNVIFGSLNSSSTFEFRNGTFIGSRTYPNLVLNIPVSIGINGNTVVQGSLSCIGGGNVSISNTSSSSISIVNNLNVFSGQFFGVSSGSNSIISVGGNVNVTAGGFTCSKSTGSFTMNVSGDINVSGGTLTLSKSSGTVSVIVANNINATGGSFIGVATGGSSNPDLSVAGNCNFLGNYYAQNGTATGIYNLLLTGSGTISMGTPSNSYNNVTVSGNYTLASDFSVGKTLLINGGGLSISNNTLKLYELLSVTSGTLTGGASSNLSFLSPSTSDANLPTITLQNLTINRSGQTINMIGDVTVGSLLNIAAGTLSIGANTLTLNSGGISGTGTMLGGLSSNLTVSGTGGIMLPALTLNNFIMNRTSNTATLGGTISVGGTLFLTNGGINNSSHTLTIGNGASIIRDNGTLSASPTFTGNYNLSYTGSTAVTSGNELTSASNVLNNISISKTGGITLNKNMEVNQILTINSAGILNASSFVIQAEGNWVNNGTFNPGTSTINFAGNTTISGTPSGGHNFYSASIGAGAALSAPVSTNVNIANSFVTTGTSTFNHNNGTITFTSNGSQTIPPLNFYNLTSTGSGARMLASSGTVGISGTFTPGTNAYTITGSTVNFNGSSAQNIPTFTFNNLTVSGATVKTLNSGNVTVNGLLNFSNGVIATGINKVIISASGSVSGAGIGNYVNGYLQKNFATGSSISRTFEIGNVSSYLPITATFATVTTSGNITANTTNNDHPQIASSCINATKSVNRYWTLTNSGVSPVNYGVVLNFVSGDVDGGASFGSFEGSLYNGSVWQNLTSGSKTSTNIQLSGATVFGDFQVGETNTPISVSISANPGTTICSGTSVTFTAIPVNGGTSPTYQWKKNNINVGTSSSTYVDNSLVNGDLVLVNIVSNSPCAFNPNATSNTLTMIVNTASTPVITPGGPTSFCAGDSVTLTSSGAVSYLWSTGATSPSIVVRSAGKDSVRITDVNGCQAYSAATVITINSASTPTITPSGPTTFCTGDSVILTSSSAVSYLWSNGSTSSSIVVYTSESDSVRITDVNGCQAYSAAVISTANPSCSYIWDGSVNTDWFNGSNWDIGFVPDSTNDVTIPSGTPNMPILSGTAKIKSINVNITASFTLNSASTLNVFGDFINNGTLIDNGLTTVVFKGNSPQGITGAASLTNLTLNNVAGLTLNNAVSVKGTLSLLKGTLTSNGNLTVDLNTGAIAYHSTDLGNISGNIKVKKNVTGIGTHDIGCPVSGTTANDMNDNTPVRNGAGTRLYTWDGSAAAYTGIFNLATALTPVTGYALYFTHASTVLDFTGSYNHGATYSSITASHSDSVNILIGNPYPSALDWYAASGWTKTNVDDAVAYYDGANTKYAYFVNGVSLGGGTQYIPSLNSFWVKRSSSGSATIGMDNNTRITSVNPSVWRTGVLSNYLKITTGIKGRNDETLIRFADDATDLYDKQLDAFKIMNPDSTPSIYTSDHKNTYAINTLSFGDKVIPLNIKPGFSGIHSISVEGTESFYVPCHIILEDKLLNVRTEINGNTQYNCTINQGDRADRFNLRVSYNAYNNNSNGKVIIGSFDKTVNLTFNNAGNRASVMVYNLMGQQITKVDNADISSGLFSFSDPKLSDGLYVVKVSIGNEIYAGKVLIK